MMSRDAGPVVTFGEMLLRLSPPPYEQYLESPQFTANFGGAEANVAVALAHLGVPSSYVTVLPDNPLGDAALAALATENVGTGSILRSTGRLGVYFVELGSGDRATRVVYDRAHSAFATMCAQSYDWRSALTNARWFHSSGITPALGTEPAAALGAAIASAREQRIPVSFDLNYRPALWTGRQPRAVIEPLVRGADVLIGNARAVREMLGVAADDDATLTAEGARKLARELSDRFHVRRVALTRREMPSEQHHRWNASIYDAESGGFAQSRIHDVQVVDRVGGGDAFAAALIASLLRESSLDDAVAFAAAMGALKLTVRGDFARFTSERVAQAVAEWK